MHRLGIGGFVAKQHIKHHFAMYIFVCTLSSLTYSCEDCEHVKLNGCSMFKAQMLADDNNDDATVASSHTRIRKRSKHLPNEMSKRTSQHKGFHVILQHRNKFSFNTHWDYLTIFAFVFAFMYANGVAHTMVLVGCSFLGHLYLCT